MNFAIIGTGRMANEHAKVIKALGHNIKCIFNRSNINKTDVFRKKFDCERAVVYYDDIAEKINQNLIDAIVVAVTWTETEKIIESLIKFGIPILVEKPVCLTSERMKEVIANNNTKHVMVGYNRRFYPFIKKIKEELENNDLISVEVSLPEKLNKYKEQGVQMLDEYPLLYSASHAIDLLLYLTGKQRCSVIFYHPQSKSINAIFENGYGAMVHFQANFNTPAIPRITFNFQDKIIQLCPIENCWSITNETQKWECLNNPVYAYGVIPEFKLGIYEQMEYFINKYILKKDIEQIGCTMQEALKVIEISEQLTRRS